MTPQTKTTVATIVALACGGFVASIAHWPPVQKAVIVAGVVAAVVGVLLYVLRSRPAA